MTDYCDKCFREKYDHEVPWASRRYCHADDHCAAIAARIAARPIAQGGEARFFVDHGVLHDRKTGMHWRERSGYPATEDCDSLNAMEAAAPGGISERYLRRCYMDDTEFAQRLAAPSPPAAGVGTEVTEGLAEQLFDIAFQWSRMLQGHVFDGRDVARTLTADFFDGLPLNFKAVDGSATLAPAIRQARAEIIRAALTAAPSAQGAKA